MARHPGKGVRWRCGAGFVFLLLAPGCSSPPTLTAESAPAVFDAAFAELSSTWHGNATSIRQATLNQTGWKNDQLESQMTMEFEWASDGALRLKAESTPLDPNERDGGMHLELLCFPDREYLHAPNGTFEARRDSVWCPMVTGSAQPADGDHPARREEGFAAMLEFHRDGRPVTVDAQGNANAMVRAVGQDEKGSRLMANATVTPAGHIVKLAGRDGSQREGQDWSIEYGARGTFERPTVIKDRAAIPATFSRTHATQPGTLALVVSPTSFGSFPPTAASELSVRLERNRTTVATLPLSGTAPVSGYSLVFTDADGDGKVSVGDQVQINGPGADTLSPVLHDDWAGHDAGYVPYKVPFAGGLLPVALLGLASWARRR